MVSAGNRAKRLPSVNHTTKTIIIITTHSMRPIELTGVTMNSGSCTSVKHLSKTAV